MTNDSLNTLLAAVLQVLDDMDCIAEYDADTDAPIWKAESLCRGTSCCVAARDQLEAAYRVFHHPSATASSLIEKLEEEIHTGLVDSNAWWHASNAGIQDCIAIVREHFAEIDVEKNLEMVRQELANSIEVTHIPIGESGHTQEMLRVQSAAPPGDVVEYDLLLMLRS